jgi:hypothetical protein
MEASGKIHAPAALPPEKRPPYPLEVIGDRNLNLGKGTVKKEKIAEIVVIIGGGGCGSSGGGGGGGSSSKLEHNQ